MKNKITFLSFIILSITITNLLAEVYISKTIKLTTTGGYNSPCFSPDDKKIAMSGLEHYKGLYLINSDGTGLKRITDESSAGYKFMWSPDGKSIAFRTIKYVEPDVFYAIKTVEVITGKIVQNTKYEDDLYPPRWIQDGNKITFVGKGTPKKIDLNAKSAVLQSLKDRNVYTDLNEVWLVEADSSKRKLVDGYNASLSPDATKIVFQRDNDIYVYDIDTKLETKISEGSWPIWSPDGTKMMYAITWDDGAEVLGSEVYISNMDGSEKQKVTDTKDLIESEPSWSNDGKKIVYADYEEGNIWISDLVIKPGIKK